MSEEKLPTSEEIQALERIQEIKRTSNEEIKKLKAQIKEMHKKKQPAIPLTKAEKAERRQIERENRCLEYVTRKKRYSTGEEIFSSIASGIGVGLAIAATVLLVLRAVFNSPEGMKPLYLTGFSVFGGTLILMYLISTLYHALTPIGAKKIFAILDHCSVYMFVAGTYTPFCLGAINGTLGWVIFGVIWALAIIGVILYGVYGSRMRKASAVTYFLMGWMIICFIKPISASIPTISLVFLLTGGAVYTVGTFFYSMKSMKWFHSIWHIFVIIGSVLHFFSIFFSI